MTPFRLSRRWFLFSGAALFATAMTPSTATFRGLPKALWAWQIDPSEWTQIDTFCQSHAISTLMLSMNASTRSSLASGDAGLLDRLGAFKRSGLTLMALGGEQDWLTRKESTLPTSLQELLQIQSQHAPFDGLHLDIEPQLLPDWKSGDRTSVGAQYLDLLARIRSAAGKQHLEVTAHPSYAEVDVSGGDLLHEVIKKVDCVALMAYRDQPDAAITFARNALPIFKSTGCSWRFGVLANSSKESGISYAGTSSSTFQADMLTLDGSLRAQGTSGYCGLIFEDYRGLNTILS